MRELHVVAVSEDGRHVVLAARRGSTKGAFKVALDATLAAALKGDLPRAGDDEVPDVSPKEIQARLRAGESVEEIARSAGVPQARVERYAGPVEGEKARMIDATRSSFVVRGRLGRSAVDLGTAVDAAIGAGGADDEGTEWSTYRLEDGTWLVEVRWYARKRTRTASWVWDPAQKTATGSDPAATALAHQESEEAAARKPKPAPRPRPVVTRAPAKQPPKRAASKASKAAAKPAAKKAVAKPAAKKVAAKPAGKPAANKTAAKPAAPRPASKGAARTSAAPARQQRVLRVVPDPVPSTAGKAVPKAARSSKQRASVPAWADVLLGTTPGADR
ncbi:MAG: putative DNA-binding protein [Frankiales bacterium]|nr:putative DNA-binding protein [Frankiales bacterium]